MHPALRETKHRPWPLPAGRWIWRQSWIDLAFLHYRVDAEVLRARIPGGVTLQEFDGSAWIGLVPFRMHRVMRRPFPSPFGQLSFPELNLRTYVEANGKPGVWFLSLDADNRLIVEGGRRLFNLPYHRAQMSHRWNREWIEFESVRMGGSPRFVARYRPVGSKFRAEPGTFEDWLAERYCMYSADPAGRLRVVDVHHAPWPLQCAEASIVSNDILKAAGVDLGTQEPIAHFSKGVDVVSFPAKEMVAAGRRVNEEVRE